MRAKDRLWFSLWGRQCPEPHPGFLPACLHPAHEQATGERNLILREDSCHHMGTGQGAAAQPPRAAWGPLRLTLFGEEELGQVTTVMRQGMPSTK